MPGEPNKKQKQSEDGESPVVYKSWSKLPSIEFHGKHQMVIENCPALISRWSPGKQMDSPSFIVKNSKYPEKFSLYLAFCPVDNSTIRVDQEDNGGQEMQRMNLYLCRDSCDPGDELEVTCHLEVITGSQTEKPVRKTVIKETGIIQGWSGIGGFVLIPKNAFDTDKSLVLAATVDFPSPVHGLVT